MLEVIKSIAGNPDKFDKLTPKKKEEFEILAEKHNITIKSRKEFLLEERELLNKIEKEIYLNSKNLNIEMVQNDVIENSPEKLNNFSQLKLNENNNNNSTTDPNEKSSGNLKDQKNSIKKKLIVVESDNTNHIDLKLDQALIKLFNKKRMSFIPVKKLSEDCYDFGTQKIQVKIDGDIIRGTLKKII